MVEMVEVLVFQVAICFGVDWVGHVCISHGGADFRLGVFRAVGRGVGWALLHAAHLQAIW